MLLSNGVTGDSGAFESDLVAPGKQWSHRFVTPGLYTYHCKPHPFMKGVVVVR